MEGRYALTVGAPENRKDISVQIFVDGIQIAEVCDDPGFPIVEFYEGQSRPIPVPVTDMLKLLRSAVDELEKRPRRKSL